MEFEDHPKKKSEIFITVCSKSLEGGFATGHRKIAGSIPLYGSKIVFLKTELDERSSIIHISKLPHFPKYVL